MTFRVFQQVLDKVLKMSREKNRIFFYIIVKLNRFLFNLTKFSRWFDIFEGFVNLITIIAVIFHRLVWFILIGWFSTTELTVNNQSTNKLKTRKREALKKIFEGDLIWILINLKPGKTYSLNLMFWKHFCTNPDLVICQW